MGGRQRRKEKAGDSKSEDARYGGRESQEQRKEIRSDKKEVGGKVAEVECHLHSSNNTNKMLKKIRSHKQLS